MSFLASIVPGIRDLRAPLIAGYMWLLFAWLLVRPDLPFQSGDGTLGSIVDLSRTAGPLATWATVSVAAYVVGAISTAHSPPLPFSSNRWRPRRSQLQGLPLEQVQKREGRWHALPKEGVATERIKAARTCYEARLRIEAYRYGLRRSGPVGQALHVVVNDATQVAESLTGAELYELRAHVHRAATRMREELTLPATLLIREQPQAFGEADRLRGEGELRLAIVVPMVALTVLLIARESWLWGAGALAACILLVQGRRRAAKATHVIATAIAYRDAPSPARDDLARYVEEIREAKREAPSIERAFVSVLKEETERLCAIERNKPELTRWQKVKAGFHRIWQQVAGLFHRRSDT